MLKSARSERKTLTEIAEQELRQAITRGTFQRGTQLPTEAELCQLLGVSRTVVREALRILEEDGLVARRHGVGTFVRGEFDFIVWRRGPTRLKGAFSEGLQ
jgi:GntR family transcriptional regulator